MSATAVRVGWSPPSTPPKPLRSIRLVKIGMAVAGVGVAGVLPWVVDGYTISLVTNAIILALLAASTHLLSTAGLPSFGQTAYFGVGAYTAAMLGRAGVTGGIPQLFAAGGCGALAALACSPVALRVRGHVYLMVTFAIGQLAVTTAAKLSVLGSDEGLTTPAITLPGGTALKLDGYLYLYALAVSVPTIAATVLLLRSRLGLVLRALADHEPRVAALGHDPTGWLVTAHGLAGAVAGIGGALLVAAHRFVSPPDLGFDVAALALLAVGIGAGTMVGTVTGAVLIIATRDLLGATTNGHGTALLGLLFLAVAYGRPPLTALFRGVRASCLRTMGNPPLPSERARTR